MTPNQLFEWTFVSVLCILLASLVIVPALCGIALGIQALIEWVRGLY